VLSPPSDRYYTSFDPKRTGHHTERGALKHEESLSTVGYTIWKGVPPWQGRWNDLRLGWKARRRDDVFKDHPMDYHLVLVIEERRRKTGGNAGNGSLC